MKPGNNNNSSPKSPANPKINNREFISFQALEHDLCELSTLLTQVDSPNQTNELDFLSGYAHDSQIKGFAEAHFVRTFISNRENLKILSKKIDVLKNIAQIESFNLLNEFFISPKKTIDFKVFFKLFLSLVSEKLELHAEIKPLIKKTKAYDLAIQDLYNISTPLKLAKENLSLSEEAKKLLCNEIDNLIASAENEFHELAKTIAPAVESLDNSIQPLSQNPAQSIPEDCLATLRRKQAPIIPEDFYTKIANLSKPVTDLFLPLKKAETIRNLKNVKNLFDPSKYTKILENSESKNNKYYPTLKKSFDSIQETRTLAHEFIQNEHNLSLIPETLIQKFEITLREKIEIFNKALIQFNEEQILLELAKKETLKNSLDELLKKVDDSANNIQNILKNGAIQKLAPIMTGIQDADSAITAVMQLFYKTIINLEDLASQIQNFTQSFKPDQFQEKYDSFESNLKKIYEDHSSQYKDLANSLILTLTNANLSLARKIEKLQESLKSFQEKEIDHEKQSWFVKLKKEFPEQSQEQWTDMQDIVFSEVQKKLAFLAEVLKELRTNNSSSFNERNKLLSTHLEEFEYIKTNLNKLIDARVIEGKIKPKIEIKKEINGLLKNVTCLIKDILEKKEEITNEAQKNIDERSHPSFIKYFEKTYPLSALIETLREQENQIFKKLQEPVSSSHDLPIFLNNQTCQFNLLKEETKKITTSYDNEAKEIFETFSSANKNSKKENNEFKEIQRLHKNVTRLKKDILGKKENILNKAKKNMDESSRESFVKYFEKTHPLSALIDTLHAQEKQISKKLQELSSSSHDSAIFLNNQTDQFKFLKKEIKKITTLSDNEVKEIFETFSSADKNSTPKKKVIKKRNIPEILEIPVSNANIISQVGLWPIPRGYNYKEHLKQIKEFENSKFEILQKNKELEEEEKLKVLYKELDEQNKEEIEILKEDFDSIFAQYNNKELYDKIDERQEDSNNIISKSLNT